MPAGPVSPTAHTPETAPSPDIASSRSHLTLETVAPGVAYLTTVFVNVYFVGEPGGPWALVDTGLPHSAAAIRHAAAGRFGANNPPAAIILTHGHFDHSGSLVDLASAWHCPIYAHPLEMPYLTGKSDYPPQDPTVGGALAFLSRFFPHNGINIAGSVHPLPGDGAVPGMPGWRWHHTPGHTAGHVSLFRDSDGVLLAGDAVATMDLDSWSAQMTERQELAPPPTPLTTDWGAARDSVGRLSTLYPSVIAAGHGVPITGHGIGERLIHLADPFPKPLSGRYVAQPAITDENGVVSLPPPVPDPVPMQLAAAAATVVGLAAAAAFERHRNGTGGDSGAAGAARAARAARAGGARRADEVSPYENAGSGRGALGWLALGAGVAAGILLFPRRAE